MRAGAVVRLVLLLTAGGAALAVAQPPATTDRNIEQIQRLEPPVPPKTLPDSPGGPTVPTGVTATPPRGGGAVIDPPPPVVQLQVRTPAHVPVGKPVPYKIAVTNNSTAKALRVKVRMPWPDGAKDLTKCEPKADGGQQGKELIWDVGDLQRGGSKLIELTFTPTEAAKKVTATAYVSFEYGATVETSIDKPKVSVKRTATPQIAVGELVTVRVEVTNPGPVALPKVRLLEQAAADAEYRGADDGEKTENAGQRAWDLGTVAAGQTKTVTYQLLPRQAGTLKTVSVVGGEGVESATAESVTKVLRPGLQLTLSGPPTVSPKAPARYSAVVRNTGDLPLSDVRLALDIPDGLTVVKQTNGGKPDRNGQRVWTFPKLGAGEAQEVLFQVEPDAGVAGKKLVKAAARDGRGVVDVQSAEAGTEFVGKADLTWKPHFDKATVPVGRRGTLSVTVTNQGAETEKGVRLRVQLPPEVKYLSDDGPVKATFENATVVFQPQPLAPGKSTEFTVTYEGKSVGPGRFVLTLEGESLGDKPLRKEQDVQVER